MHLHDERFTSSEISNLWTHYIRETLSICVTKYMLKIVKDPEIHSVFKLALELSLKHMNVLRALFKKEEFPIPKGFTEEDVNLEAPPIFTENYCILYIYTMSMHGMQAFSLAFSVSVRKDIRDFYYQCNLDAMNIYNKAIEVLTSKQLLEKPPYYTIPKKVATIKNFKYVTDVFGKPRAMNSIESGNLYFNLQKSLIAKGSFLAFNQVCKDEEVKQFIEKCKDGANKHVGVFSNLLLKEDLHSPSSLEPEIIHSTVAPFSDKLLLVHSGFLVAAAISYYGAAAVAVMRADLSLLCEKAIIEDIMLYASFGKLIIQKNWMEQPPESNDRRII
jgi:rubrerythrin